MMTVHEVSELAHVSVRALHHYDDIGLLRPSGRTDAGYRLYSDEDIARLQQVLLFRELGFPLREIGTIIDSPHYDQSRALEQQVELLRLKREHIDKLIELAEEMMKVGKKPLGFEAFDTSKIDEYAAQAKASWGTTPEWAEYQHRSSGRTKKEEMALGEDLMALFEPFGRMAADGADPASPEAAAQARLIQAFITEHFYTCTDEVFLGLGQMYGAGGDFTRNIDAAAGEGAAIFAMHAIEACMSA